MADLLKRRTKLNRDKLFLLVIGPSKVGKSYFQGSAPKGNTLRIHGKNESHGGVSSENSNKIIGEKGSEVYSVEWDFSKGNLKDFYDVLSADTIKKHNIKTICLDSITELTMDVQELTSFKQKVTNDKGKVNQFHIPRAIVETLASILKKLRILQTDHGIDVICTVNGRIIDMNGERCLKPDVPSFSVAEFLAMNFDDCLPLVREGDSRYFLTNLAVKRVSNNNETKVAERFLDFNPCLLGVNELPERIEPTIDALLRLKGANNRGSSETKRSQR